jgi:hypothetical protein
MYLFKIFTFGYSSNLTVVIYGGETWSRILREECSLKVFENRVLRRIFGPKNDQNWVWRRVHNEEPYFVQFT